MSFHYRDFERPSSRNGFACGDKGEAVPGAAGEGLVALPVREVAAGSAVYSGGGLVEEAAPGVGRAKGWEGRRRVEPCIQETKLVSYDY